MSFLKAATHASPSSKIAYEKGKKKHKGETQIIQAPKMGPSPEDVQTLKQYDTLLATVLEKQKRRTAIS